MMLWVVFAVLTGLAVFAVLWPLSRPPATLDSRELDVAFYKAQSEEIAREQARGLIGTAEADMARNEAGRRLIAARAGDRRPRSAQANLPNPRPGSSVLAARTVALAVLVFVPLVSLSLYLRVGHPNLPDDPLSARLQADPKTMDMATMIATVERNVAKNPNDGRGWAILAMIYGRLGRYDDAVTAFRNEIRILGPSGDRYAALGEAQMQAADEVVTADARKSFQEAVRLDPRSPRANYYLGIAAMEDGDKPKALAIFEKIVAESKPNAPWLPIIADKIAMITGDSPGALPTEPPAGAAGSASAAPASSSVPAGPMAAAVAAMPTDQQQAMIHRMVEGLATRLKQNGADIEGWLRLVRAYRVLDETDRAKIALAAARRNFASDPNATRRLATLAHELGLES